MNADFEREAQTLVDQHYASGPEGLKKAIAQALAEASVSGDTSGTSRKQLLSEVRELEKTSQRGSE